MNAFELRNPGMMEQAFPELVLRGQFLLNVSARVMDRFTHLFRGAAGEPRYFVHRKSFERKKHKSLAVLHVYSA